MAAAGAGDPFKAEDRSVEGLGLVEIVRVKRGLQNAFECRHRTCSSQVIQSTSGKAVTVFRPEVRIVEALDHLTASVKQRAV
ncbi:hypothetical protein EME01_04490 [Sinorhizobium meliloti]|nr:hypothetical protein EME01_04490 [Sinorhizobium meliloti]